MLQFVYEPEPMTAVRTMTERLIEELSAGKSVAWFVSGGSNTVLSVAAMDAIPDELTTLLTVLLVDERFGLPGHADSNWTSLYNAGFTKKRSTVIETIQGESTLADSAKSFEQAVKQVIATSDRAIAQIGIGGDGHIAGILPHSAGLTQDSWVAHYDGGTYQRITITPVVIPYIDAAYTFAYGDGKLGTLQRLAHDSLPIADQPAQLLKAIPESFVFTDQQID